MNTRQIINQIYKKYQTNNLIDILHDHLIEKDTKNKSRKTTENIQEKFYPSSIGNCHRRSVYEIKGWKGIDKTGKEMLTLENGTYFHNRMEDIFEEMGIMIAPELPLRNKDLKISGKSDAIIYNFLLEEDEEDGDIITLNDKSGNEVYSGPSNHVLIVEFKSVSFNFYEKHTTKKFPYIKHELQLQLYFYLTGITKGLIYYENKNNQAQKYFIVERNEELIKQIVSEIKYLVQLAEDNMLPPRQYTLDSFECRYCPFINYCYPSENDLDLEDFMKNLKE